LQSSDPDPSTGIFFEPRSQNPELRNPTRQIAQVESLQHITNVALMEQKLPNKLGYTIDPKP